MGNKWHATPDTWHVTHDRWFLSASYIPLANIKLFGWFQSCLLSVKVPIFCWNKMDTVIWPISEMSQTPVIDYLHFQVCMIPLMRDRSPTRVLQYFFSLSSGLQGLPQVKVNREVGVVWLLSSSIFVDKFLLQQGSSENDGRSEIYDRSEFKVISNCCYNNCCCTNCSHFYLYLPEYTLIFL